MQGWWLVEPNKSSVWGTVSLRCPLNIRVVILQLDIDSFKAMGLHEIIHRLSRNRKEKIWELSELWHLQSLQVGKELEREWLVGEVEETERVHCPRSKEKIIPEEEQSTLLTAAGSHKIND